MMQLRPYQAEAVQAVWQHLKTRPDNPCVVLPTGSGKTHVLASICRDAVQWGGRVLVLSHVKELLAQAADKMRLTAPDVRCGLHSAGLGRRDTEEPVLIAGIQSVYKRAEELGHFHLVVIDEAHLVPPDGDGMYQTFLAAVREINPRLRVVGLTATPFRTSSGPICTPDGILNHVCYEANVRDLIEAGYLCPLVTKAGVQKPDFDRLHIRGGEFIPSETADLMNDGRLVRTAVDEIAAYSQDRQSVLLFATGIDHGQHVVDTMRKRHGLECGFVTGDTPQAERDETLRRFQDGGLRFLANVGVLTTGFDCPRIDCVALLRPTMSPGLYSQMVGRGFRLHPDKENCLILDFGGNAMRHGPVDGLTVEAVEERRRKGKKRKQPGKECPVCRSVVASGCATCPDCRHTFPAPAKKKHDEQAADRGILSDDFDTQRHSVLRTWYVPHTKKGAPPGSPQTLRVSYEIGPRQYVSEWISVEHSGRARYAAEGWWKKRSNEPLPETAAEAAAIARAGGLARCTAIATRTLPGQRFPQIAKYELGPIPTRRSAFT